MGEYEVYVLYVDNSFAAGVAVGQLKEKMERNEWGTVEFTVLDEDCIEIEFTAKDLQTIQFVEESVKEYC